METRDIVVPNGDFEAGLATWSSNPRAAVDTDVRHGGKQSARITIPADQTDSTGIYLVQNVPIIGGRLYSVAGFVKSQDVKAVSLGDMSPTGATVILEWADKDGKWLASGDYANGLYGTTDWQKADDQADARPEGRGLRHHLPVHARHGHRLVRRPHDDRGRAPCDPAGAAVRQAGGGQHAVVHLAVRRARGGDAGAIAPTRPSRRTRPRATMTCSRPSARTSPSRRGSGTGG